MNRLHAPTHPERLGALRRENDALRTLHRELVHRQANQLNLVYQLLQLRRSGSSPADESAAAETLAELSGQLLAFRAVNARLNVGPGADVCLATVLRDLTEALRAASPLDFALRLDLRPARVCPEVATRLGLVVNELLTNSIKYGLPADGSGAVSLRLDGEGLAPKPEKPALRLTYEDSGRPRRAPAPQASPGGGRAADALGKSLVGILLGDVGARQASLTTATGGTRTIIRL